MSSDYVDRQKQSGVNLNTFILQQLPVPSLKNFDSQTEWHNEQTVAEWIQERVIEVTYSSYDMAEFAAELGDAGPPFRWDEQRRFAMRAELDAAFFHLYGIDRDDVDYIMETFPIVKRKDIQQYGTFRTKDLILQIYDAMAEATPHPHTLYQTILDPPSGHGPSPPCPF